MPSRFKGVGRGNYGGRFVGERKSYDTQFDFLLGRLLAQKPSNNIYKPTTRGIQKVLGLDGCTFQKYRDGTSKPPTVVIAHMVALFHEDLIAIPGDVYWDCVAHFSIRTVFENSGGSDGITEMLEIHLDNCLERWTFRVRPFAITQNRKFRQVIFQQTGEITSPMKPKEWKLIVDQARVDEYRSPEAPKFENLGGERLNTGEHA